MPKLSVILTCYNSKKEYLDECIESILNQTFKDFELLVIDDCSTVPIKDLISEYLEKDKRIKYFKTPKNGGPASARNFGIKKAVGEYLSIMDHDDIADLKKFEKQVLFLDEHPDIGVLGGAFKRFPNEKEFHLLIEDKDITLSMLLNQNEFCHSCVMIRKSLLDTLGITYQTDKVPAEDYALFLDLIGKTKFHNLSDILIYYRSHETNLSKLNVEKVIYFSAELKVHYLTKLFKIKDTSFQKALLNLDLNHITKMDLVVLEKQLPLLINEMKKQGYEEEKIIYWFNKKYLKTARKLKSPYLVFKMFKSSLTRDLKIAFFERYILMIKNLIKSLFN